MESMEEKELTASEELAQMEQEKLTRRQALYRFGFHVGAAAIAALTADELLRKVGAEMQKRAGDSKVAQQVARELSNAGVAMAVPPPCWPLPNASDCGPADSYNHCRYHFYYNDSGAPCWTASTGPNTNNLPPCPDPVGKCKACCEKIFNPGNVCQDKVSPTPIASCKTLCESHQPPGGPQFNPFDQATPAVNPCANVVPE